MSHYQPVCSDCTTTPQDPAALVCPSCNGLLEFRYDYGAVAWDERFKGNMWRYWPLLPVPDPERISTLGEGGTPLLRARAYPGFDRVHLKDETRNPTGSHKDRSLSVGINHGRAVGARASIVISTGSAGISNAALSSRAGMVSVVVMSAGTPPQRLYPMFALGAVLVEVEGEIDTMVEMVTSACREQGLYPNTTTRSANPYQSEGNKTVAYEIVDDLGRAPEWVVVPVGGGGTIAGIWRGFRDLEAMGRISALPRMIGVVPRDYNALETALNTGMEEREDLLALPFHDAPPSILVKLAHPYPPDGMDALGAVRASQGFFISVSDAEALNAQSHVGRSEGLYVEPSSGASLAGLARLLESGRIGRKDTVVAVVSGSGYRETFLTMEKRPLQKKSADLEDLPAVLAQAAAAGP